MHSSQPKRPSFGRLTWAVALAVTVLPWSLLRSQELPAKLSDSAFWQLITDVSEPGGAFRSDNFVSNEMSYQQALGELSRRVKPGSVYVGVGPDQNFTYILALHPGLSFICDIRRQNLLEHLMYKAVIEQSPDRADFVSYLFSRPRPAGLDSASTAKVLMEQISTVPADSVLYRRHLGELESLLTKTHGFALTEEDLKGIEYVFGAFYTAGPNITYNFPGYGGRGFMRAMPTYAEIVTATNGKNEDLGYLGSEANYHALRQLERDNLIVPVVGDFGGGKALRAIGSYAANHGAHIGAFYLSNVEQYLFQTPDLWRRFYINVGTMPIDSGSTFIRAAFNGMGFRAPGGVWAVMLLAPVADQLRMFSDGQIMSYYDVIQSSKQP